MEIKYIASANAAMVSGEENIITGAQSALDLIATVQYETGCACVIIRKENIADDFFKLSTGLAGEVLQKFVNYRFRIIVVGDFSNIQSKPLRDFIYECNNGRQIGFVGTEAEAIERLASFMR